MHSTHIGNFGGTVASCDKKCLISHHGLTPLTALSKTYCCRKEQNAYG